MKSDLFGAAATLVAAAAIDERMFASTYANVFEGNPAWNAIQVAEGDLFAFDESSTYIQDPPFFQDLTLDVPRVDDIRSARILAVLGDSVTTDHISRYRAEGVPLVVIAGKEYGSGSSRDWAAKGTLLLGVRAVIAESYERIHRSNLVGMGVLPLQFKAGESASTFGITGREVLTVVGLSGALQPRQDVTVDMLRADGSRTAFVVTARLDSPVEVTYYRNGGILHTVLRKMLGG